MTTQGLVTFEENKKSISKVSKILRRTEFCLAKKPFATASNAPPPKLPLQIEKKIKPQSNGNIYLLWGNRCAAGGQRDDGSRRLQCERLVSQKM